MARDLKLTDTQKEQLKLLKKTSVIRSLYAIFLNYAIILSFAALSIFVFNSFGPSIISYLVYIITLFIIAARIRGQENLLHDAQHFNLSRNTFWNESIAWFLLALPLGRNVKTERYDHVKLHHTNFWSQEDPDKLRYKEMGLDKLPADSYLTLLKIVFNAFPSYISGTVRAFFIPLNESKALFFGRLSFWILTGSVFFQLGQLNNLFSYWFAAFFFVLPILRFIAELSEHAGLDCDDELVSTRNNLGWFNEWFIQPNGSGFHLVHHMYAQIPFFALDKAHLILMESESYSKACHCHSFLFSTPKGKSTIESMLK